MVDGALTQVVSGLLLVGGLEGQDESVDHRQSVKFAIGLVVAVLVWINRRKPEIPAGLFWGLRSPSATLALLSSGKRHPALEMAANST